MKNSLRGLFNSVVAVVISGMALSVLFPEFANASRATCVSIFDKNTAPSSTTKAPFTTSTEPLAALDNSVWSWAEHSQSKVKPVDAAIVTNMLGQRLALTVLGGSSIHGILPVTDANGQAKPSASVKLYFKPPGPSTFTDLARMIVDASLPSLKAIVSSGRTNSVNAKDEDPILLVPSPGQVVQNGEAILLPANFGVLGNQVFQLPQLVQAELEKRAVEFGLPQLARTRVIVQNDSYSLAATVGTRASAHNGERTKLVFAGTGLGEANIVKLGKGRFKSLSVEGGHALVNDYPGLAAILPVSVLDAAEIVKKSTHDNSGGLEFENLVAGGREGHHLSGAVSVLMSLLLPAEKVPTWISDTAGDKLAPLRKNFLAYLQAKTTPAKLIHPADQALAQTLETHGYVSLAMVSQAAVSGAPVARAIMSEISYTQGVLAGVMATEFGTSPSGAIVSADWVYESTGSQLTRTVSVRADGSLIAWASFMSEAKRGVRDGIVFQLNKNPVYIAKLLAAGIAPGALTLHSFKLTYGNDLPQKADADLESLEELSRNNF